MTDETVTPKPEPEPDPQPEAAATAASTATATATMEPVSRRRRRGNRVLVSIIVVIALLAAAGIGATYYYVDSVMPGPELIFPETTTLYFADGTEMVELGDIKRHPQGYEDLLPVVAQATVAADDPDFWGGRVTAITRSVVRQLYDLGPDARRARLVVLAWKLEDAHTKEEILELYLNTAPYGRQTYGVEAAARAYFGKSARADAPPEGRLTVAEAIALAAMPRQPEADPAGPVGRPGYDPTRGEAAEENAGRRFEEIRATMVDLGYLPGDAAVTFPLDSFRPRTTDDRLNQPTGLLANQVLSELTYNPRSPFNGWEWQALRDGGYQIHTTIDPRAQAAVEAAVNRDSVGSPLNGQPADLQPAAVMVEPGTGRVLAYYGGASGTGADYAGIHRSENGEAQGFGAHPPGGSFHIHTLAAALNAGYSLRSRWNSAPHDMPGRTGANQIRNTGRCPTGTDVCTLADSTMAGLETTFYEVTLSVTPVKVLEMARAAGVRTMWNDQRSRVDLLSAGDVGTLVPSQFDTVLGLGQYPVTVVDQANAMATYAAGGPAAQAHFVAKVLDGDKQVYGEALPADTQERIMSAGALADLTWILSHNQAGQIPGQVSASKTGQWQHGTSVTDIGDAWMVGATTSLALAVWVGGAKGEPIHHADGRNVFGSTLPAAIYRQAMTGALAALDRPAEPFPPPSFVGDEHPPRSVP
jgi:membrane peptidoglycan carboxypeptidase